MRTRPTILYFGPADGEVPDLVQMWATGKEFPVSPLDDPAEVEAIVMRGHPCLIVLDGERTAREGRSLVARLKADPFSAIVPVIVL